MNAVDLRHNSPLHYAAMNDSQSEIVDVLLSARGIDVDAKMSFAQDVPGRDPPSATPLHIAAMTGSHSIVEKLIAGGSRAVNVGARNSITALHFAAMWNHAETARVLLTSWAFVDARNSNYWTPLHFAALRNSTRVARVLLSSEADINAVDCDHWTPLHFATLYNHTEVVRTLLSSGANVTVKAIYTGIKLSTTALHLAAEKGFDKIVQLLLDAGADISLIGRVATCARVRLFRKLSPIIIALRSRFYGGTMLDVISSLMVGI